MPAYYDTGALVPLYVEEVFSDPVTAFVESRNEIILFNAFQQLELDNALRLKVFRGEMDSEHCNAVLGKIRAHIGEGRIMLRPVNWVNAMEDARRMGARVTARAGCRTLDLLHVAIAAQWDSDVFVTADDRQLRAARAAGLRTVDVRAIPGKSASGDSSPGIVRERRALYGAKKVRASTRRPGMSRVRGGTLRPGKKRRVTS